MSGIADIGAAGVQPADFRAAMAHLAAAVSVVTACHGEQTLGVTISSLASLSLEPPLVMFALHRNGSMLEHLVGGRFGITVLGRRQRGIAAALALRGRAPVPAAWLHAACAQGVAPTLRGGVLRLTATLSRRWRAGDHVIHVAHVLSAIGSSERPLLYHRRAYVELAASLAADR